MLVQLLAGILGLGLTVGMIYQSATWDLPLRWEDAIRLAATGLPIWLAAKFVGWVSFVLNDVVKYGITGAFLAIPVCATIMAFRSPVMIVGYLGLGMLLMLAWGDMVKWEMRRERFAIEDAWSRYVRPPEEDDHGNSDTPS